MFIQESYKNLTQFLQKPCRFLQEPYLIPKGTLHDSYKNLTTLHNSYKNLT